MTSQMEPRVPLDILHCLGKTINCRATLATLCRVSKELKRIFTPLLYRKVHVQDCEYALLERITNYRDGSFEGFNPNLKFTNELTIGRNLRNYPGSGATDASGEDHDVLTIFLQSMPNLIALGLSTDIDVFNVNRKGITDGRFSFALLQSPDTLRDLVLAGSRYTRPFDLPLRGFQNLNKLVLNRVRGGHSADAWINDITSVLFRSPSLKSLALSLDGRQSDLALNTWLRPFQQSGCLVEICQRYHAERENRKAPLLSLVELDLGNGFIPTDLRSHTDDIDSDYLSRLTDLAALRTLKIKNFVRSHEDSDSTDRVERENSSAGTLHFHAPVLYKAVNIATLSVTKLTADVIRLISRVLVNNPPSHLSSIQFGGVCPSPNDMEDMGIDPDEEFLVHSLHSTGFHWRSLDISDVNTNSSNLIDYLKRCKSLQELSCRMSERRLELFKQKVLPRLENLHTLTIGNIQTDNLVDHIFPNPIPRTTNVGLELKADPETRKSKSLFRSLKSLALKTESQKEWKEELRLREEEANGEKRRQEIAEDLFKVSWKAWERRKDGERGVKLKYVGLGYRVYTYLLPGPGENGKKDKWKVVRLSHDDAMEFEAVKNLLFSEDA